MTPRKLGFSVLLVMFLAIHGMNLLGSQAEWIKNSAIGIILLLGSAAVFSEWRQHRANRRASLRDKFSKMARHDNAR